MPDFLEDVPFNPRIALKNLPKPTKQKKDKPVSKDKLARAKAEHKAQIAKAKEDIKEHRRDIKKHRLLIKQAKIMYKLTSIRKEQ